MGLDTDPELEDTEASMVQWLWAEISGSYLNLALTLAILYLVYKILTQGSESSEPLPPADPEPAPLKKQVLRY